jgi:hypothetical protein
MTSKIIIAYSNNFVDTVPASVGVSNRLSHLLDTILGRRDESFSTSSCFVICCIDKHIRLILRRACLLISTFDCA